MNELNARKLLQIYSPRKDFSVNFVFHFTGKDGNVFIFRRREVTSGLEVNRGDIHISLFMVTDL